MSGPSRALCHKKVCQRSKNVDVLSMKIETLRRHECRSGRNQKTEFSSLLIKSLFLIDSQLLILADAQVNAAGDSFLSWDDLIGHR